MRATLLFLLSLVLFLSPLGAAEPEFPLTEDSKPQANVPKGEQIKNSYTAGSDSVFPGTVREYTLYLPPGFDKTKAAPFMVFQDGVIYQAPTVFDNLIAKKEIPPLVGVFVKPGVVPAVNENALPRFNRSYEYDSVTDAYARFLIDELLPAIEQKHGIKLSTHPNDAGISGNSSGGIAAFMVAWHRHDRFRRVFTGVGTYVGIHGGDRLPVLVRKFEPKPIKIFLQSGTGDNNLYCGDWWMANQMMERSFTWAGYDVNHAWGEGGHNQKHASQIFPEVLRWLWKGWPENKEVKANPRGESKWRGYEVLPADNSSWTAIPLEKSLVSLYKVAPDKDGTVHTLGVSVPPGTDEAKGDLISICSAGQITRAPSEDVQVVAMSGEPMLLTRDGNGRELVKMNPNAKDQLLRSDVSRCAPAVTYSGRIFWGHHKSIFTKTIHDTLDTPLEGYMDPYSGAEYVGLALAPDQTVLYAVNASSGCVDTFSILAGQESPISSPQIGYVQLETSGTGGLCVDTDGRLYVATWSGIEVCDQAGRVNFIIPTPAVPYDVCFGGKNLSELFIACGDKIYKRSTKVRGVVSGQTPPIKAAAPKL